MSAAHQDTGVAKKSTPESSHTASPEISPPSKAIMPRNLVIARAELDKARRISMELRATFEALKRKVEPEVAPDQEQPEIDRNEGFELASLGMELAWKDQESLTLEGNVVDEEEKAGILDPKSAEKRRRELNWRSLSAGDQLWIHKRKKMRFEDPGTVRVINPFSGGISELLLTLYKQCDGQEKYKKKRDPNWRRNALAYYAGNSNDHKDAPPNNSWCQITGRWHQSDYHKAAHIVPFLLDDHGFGELLFGDRAQSLQRAGNALLLSDRVKRWFDSYHIVVVPVNAMETPITRWRTEVISPDIRNHELFPGFFGKELDKKELVFLNEKRPVSRFLYFHFIMALIRIKDLKRRGWQDVWARYYHLRPFGTPGNYMRKSILIALATHHGTVGLSDVEAYLAEHGFDSPINLTDDETTEAARRVYMAVEAAIKRAESEEGEESEEEPGEEPEESEEEPEEREKERENESEKD